MLLLAAWPPTGANGSCARSTLQQGCMQSHFGQLMLTLLANIGELPLCSVYLKAPSETGRVNSLAGLLTSVHQPVKVCRSGAEQANFQFSPKPTYCGAITWTLRLYLC